MGYPPIHGGRLGGRMVSESALTSRINAAREAVGDSGKDQRIIRTSARKGLRFVGAVQVQPAGDEIAPVVKQPPDEKREETPLALPLPVVEPLLIVRRALREQIVILHRRLLAIVRHDEVCWLLMTTPG